MKREIVKNHPVSLLLNKILSSWVRNEFLRYIYRIFQCLAIYDRVSLRVARHSSILSYCQDFSGGGLGCDSHICL